MYSIVSPLSRDISNVEIGALTLYIYMYKYLNGQEVIRIGNEQDEKSFKFLGLYLDNKHKSETGQHFLGNFTFRIPVLKYPDQITL